MNNKAIRIGTLVLLAALLSACATGPVADGKSAAPAAAYSHDAYFY